MWGWIKRWFDPNTVSKIFVLGQHETKATLEKFFEPSSIPKAYGGELDWSYGDLPAMDAEIRQRVGHEWMKGPARWEGQYVPLGTENGKQRPRPDPIPEDQRPPLVQVAPVGASAAPTTTIPDKVKSAQHQVDVATNGVAGLTVVDHDKGSGPTNVENPASTDTVKVNLPESSVGGDVHANGDVPSKPVEAPSDVLREGGKETVAPNGIPKPPLERFETAAEVLPTNGMARV